MEVALIYGGIGVLAIVVYIIAVKSRKSYTCPECGEKVNTEHMTADRCGVCGSTINQDSNG